MKSRRIFIKKSVLGATSLLFVKPVNIMNLNLEIKNLNIKSKGYAAKDSTGKLSLWEFERRPLGDNDVLIEIKYSGVCHSDIHTVRGDWGSQKYPQVPGHEIAGVVTAVGKNVKKFKVGDHAGVGCMVDSCGDCHSCEEGHEQYCEKRATLYTYGTPDKTSPTGITQGGYANNIVVKEKFVIKIPKSIELKHAAPLLCAGVTTYAPLMRAKISKGMKVGIAGIGGLGHIAIKLAAEKGADVYAFTTSPDKVNDIKSFGAKEVIVVDDIQKLRPYFGKLDYLISTIPHDFDLGAYASLVKPYGYFTQIGLPAGKISFNNFSFIINRVNYNGSLIGGIPETQEVMDYCAENKIYPNIEIIDAKDLNEVYDKVIEKKARYRYVIDAKTI
jgi:alcohol dehydrogenase (NADP+)/uncharacterized zinc-type alcohol dehydrogenase-like protein